VEEQSSRPNKILSSVESNMVIDNNVKMSTVIFDLFTQLETRKTNNAK